jgi:hypothetical protein
MSFLMIFTLMTYGKLNHFRDRSVLRELFRVQMESQERRSIIEIVKNRYDETPVDRTKKGDEETEKKSKEKASSRLSLYMFLGEEGEKTQGDLQEPVKMILKGLIYDLYKNAPFFKQDPEFLETLVNSMLNLIKKGQKGVTLSSGKDLANLEFQDHPLDRISYHMIKGNPPPSGDEERKNEGYLPLSNFITFKNTEKIRVYLAPKELLNQIFDRDSEVPYILKSREDLYLKLKSKRIDEKSATQEFSSFFRGKQNANIPDKLLDYTVSSSNPKDYS